MKDCPVCQAPREAVLVERYREFTIWLCPDCDLQFSNPMRTDFAYDQAYAESNTAEPGGGIYQSWMDEWEARCDRSRYLWALAPEQRTAMKWLRRRFPQRGAVVDLGCGIGEFLIALKTHGFNPYGMDLSRTPIERLQRDGFQAVAGSVENCPGDWPAPQAVTLFHVLEHVPDPVDFLQRVRRRFPEAALIVAVPSPRRWGLRRGQREEFDYPPHHMTRWTGVSLRRALLAAGYQRIVVKLLPLLAQEMTGLGLGRLLGRLAGRGRRGLAQAGHKTAMPSALQHDVRLLLIKRVVYGLPALLFRLGDWSGGSMMAFAGCDSSKSVR